MPTRTATAREAALAWVPGLLVTAVCLVRVAYLVARPDVAITVVPDDAFYYLQLAHNRVQLGAWTFDGAAQTSGFHLLHAYLLALLDLVLGDAGRNWLLMLGVVGTFASFALGLAAALLVRAGRQVNGDHAGWWAVVVLASAPVVITSTMLMESHLVILGAAAVLAVVADPGRPTGWRAAGILVVGMLAALTRSDFVILPGILWLTCLATWRADQDRARRATLVLVGSLAGFGLTVLHTFLISGTLLQTSVLTKLRWSSTVGLTWGEILAIWNVMLLVVVGAFVLVVVRRPDSLRLFREPIGLACLFSLLAYGVVYGLAKRGFQVWYGASMVVPLAFFFTMVGGVVRPRWSRAVAAVLVVASVLSSLLSLGTQQWPWQLGMLHAAERLREDLSIDHVGAWNAGILAIVSGKTVTNLDGLVDDRAAEANAEGRLFDYVRERGIEDIVDHADALEAPGDEQPDPRLQRCVRQVAVLSDPGDPRSGSGPVTLFRLVPGCE